MNVAVVGLGFAGSALALALSRRGHTVTVYEQAVEPSPIGAGILIQPTGMHVLKRLGLLDACRERGAVVDRLRCRTARGATLFNLPYGSLREDLHGLGMHRGSLFEVLFGALQRTDVDIKTGVEIVDVQGGGLLLDASGRGFGPHDLVVVANGAQSKLRSSASLSCRATPYPWGALWFVGSDPNGVFDGELAQVVQGTRRMLGFLPSGRDPAGNRCVSLFWSVRVDRAQTVSADLPRLLGTIRSYEPRSEFLLEQIRSPGDLLCARYVDVRMGRIRGANLVVIGDAAHATSPQLGQGTNLALMDAIALADRIGKGAVTGAVLAEYVSSRRHHVKYYQWASRWLTPVFQSGLSWLGPIRDRLLPLVGRFKWLQRQMLLTLAGVKRGLFRKSLGLPEL